MKKHMLIIGGTRGMGRALVRTLAEADHVLSVIGQHSPTDADQSVLNVKYWKVNLLDQESLAHQLASLGLTSWRE